MGTVASKFEELLVWQNARKLNQDIYVASSDWKDWELKDQIRRAAISISSNIAEGFDRGSKPDFTRFLYIARGSGTEVRSQLYLALDLKYLTQIDFNELHGRVDYIVRQLSLLIAKLRS